MKDTSNCNTRVCCPTVGATPCRFPFIWTARPSKDPSGSNMCGFSIVLGARPGHSHFFWTAKPWKRYIHMIWPPFVHFEFFKTLTGSDHWKTGLPYFSQSRVEKDSHAMIDPHAMIHTYMCWGCICLCGQTYVLGVHYIRNVHKHICFTLTWLVLVGDPAARSHIVEQFTAKQSTARHISASKSQDFLRQKHGTLNTMQKKHCFSKLGKPQHSTGSSNPQATRAKL